MAIPKIELKYSQVFGDKVSMDRVSEEDLISELKFDKTGQYLALGDRAGRLILFEDSGSNKINYQYMSELQSHMREFDYLKSADIEEKINQIQWLRPQSKNLYICTTNDKTIKLWKISEKSIKKPIKSNSPLKQLTLPKMEVIESGWIPSLRKSFPNLHEYLINSISVSDNEELLISSDDLRIYLWNLQRPDVAFNLIDLKPDNLEDVQEVITCSKYHPVQDNQMLYGTSKGLTKICDMRKTGICDKSGILLIDNQEQSSKNFFTDLVSSISDCQFSKNGRYVFTRDFLTLRVWDINMPNKPVTKVQVFEPLKSKLCELYENECIFDKFDISLSNCSNYVVTGNFNMAFHMFDRNGEFNQQYELNFRKKTILNNIPQKYFENLGNTYDFNKKVLKTTFHPSKNYVAVACLNSLFFYGV